MGMKLAKDAVKIGFADISIQKGTSSQPFFGYFIESQKSVQDRTDLVYTLAAEENCNKENLFADDTLVQAPNSVDVAVDVLPTNQDLTTPPNTMKVLDNPYVQAGILGVGVYLFIKLVS
jgi:hypothetical protein